LKAFMVKTNDNMVTIYLASLIRSVTALHDLINNKLEFREAEHRGETEKEAKKKEKSDKKEETKEGEKGGEKEPSKDSGKEKDKK